MNWNSPAEFFAMGGYGLYVWGAYLVTAVCLLAEPVLAAQRHRRARESVRAAEAAGNAGAAVPAETFIPRGSR